MRQLSMTSLIILVLILTAALVANIPEVRRYLRIRNMKVAPRHLRSNDQETDSSEINRRR
jgi:hypothetical protein